MQLLNDLERFTLADGDTLILRPRKALTVEQLTAIRKELEILKLRIVVIPHGFDIYAGNVEVIEPVEDEQAERDAALEAYNEGHIVQFRHPDSPNWYEAHKHVAPLPVDWQHHLRRVPK